MRTLWDFYFLGNQNLHINNDTLVLIDNREDRRFLYSDNLTVAVSDNLFNVLSKIVRYIN